MKKILLLFTLFITFLSFSFTTPQYVAINDLSNSILKLYEFNPDNTKTNKIKLQNGLEVCLVSDPSLTFGGAVITVKAGAWDSPKDALGLAHFTEHMIFMGSEGYPEENSFSQFISNHGGEKNAFTADVFTSYYFTVESSALNEGLKRFSELFRAPLFSQDSLARERQAIEEEHAKNLGNENRRIRFVQKELSSSDHSYHYFSTGNKETLSKVDSKQLKSWWQKHYSADTMRLIVYSPEPLENLTKNVVENFEKIPQSKQLTTSYLNKNLTGSPFEKRLQKKMIYVEPFRPLLKLQINWEIAANLSGAEGGVSELATLLQSSQVGSLANFLQSKNLASSVEVSNSWLGYDKKVFTIDIYLTEKGAKNINTVIKNTYQQIALYKANLVPQKTLDSLQQMAFIDLQSKNSETALAQKLTSAAESLPFEPISSYPALTINPYQATAENIRTLAKTLTAERAHYIFVAPATVSGVQFDHQEKWLGAFYTRRAISLDLIYEWDKVKADPMMKLAEPNPFLPVEAETNLMNSVDSQGLLLKNEYMDLFLQPSEKKDGSEVWQLNITTPKLINRDLRTNILMNLYLTHLHNLIKPTINLAAEVGNKVMIQHKANALSIKVVGNRGAAEKLIQLVLENINKQTTSNQFVFIQNELIHRLSVDSQDSALTQAVNKFYLLTDHMAATNKDKMELAKNISYAEFTIFSKNLFANYFVNGTIYGNLSREKSETFLARLPKIIIGNPYVHIEENIETTSDRPKINLNKPVFVWEKSSSIGNGLLLALKEPENSVSISGELLQITMQAVQSYYFDELRTKQQTAYIVESNPLTLNDGTHSASFMIQSNTYSSAELLDRTEQFLQDYLKKIKNKEAFTKEEFGKIKQALISQIKQQTSSVETTAEELHTALFVSENNVNWREKKIEVIKNISYEEALSYIQKLFSEENQARLAIGIYGKTLGAPSASPYLAIKAPYATIEGLEQGRALLYSV